MGDGANSQHFAEECVRQAEEATAPEQKALLLMMAQAWGRLSSQSERIRSLLRRAESDNGA